MILTILDLKLIHQATLNKKATQSLEMTRLICISRSATTVVDHLIKKLLLDTHASVYKYSVRNEKCSIHRSRES